jgi:hypothetical protein
MEIRKDGQIFYREHFTIEVTLHSASLSFKIIHAGQTYGIVQVEFV